MEKLKQSQKKDGYIEIRRSDECRSDDDKMEKLERYSVQQFATTFSSTQTGL